MNHPTTKTRRPGILQPLNSPSWLGIAITLLVFAAGFRLLRVIALPDLPNFSPLMAVAFCGAWFLPGMLALAVPLLALIISDIALSAQYASLAPGIGDFIRYACYAGAAVLGILLRRHNASPVAFLGGVLGSAIGFYLITNSMAWLGSPLYPQTFAGWIQSLTVGLPGYPPTWTFFRNSLVSDLLFSGVMVGIAVLAQRKSHTLVHA